MKIWSWVLGCSSLVALLGCGDGASATVDAGASDARPPDGAVDAAPDAAPRSVTLSQTATTIVVPNTSWACGEGPTSGPVTRTLETSYYRMFPLAPTVSGALRVRRVTFGIERAAAAGGQTVEVALYQFTGAGAFTSRAQLAQLGHETVAVPDAVASVQVHTLVTPVLVPAGSILVVEVRAPGAAATVFIAGSTASAETAPTYQRAPGCGSLEPTKVTSLPLHMVLEVTGDAL